jgi:hypothetical protein
MTRPRRKNRRFNDGGDAAEPGVRTDLARGAMDAHAAPECRPLELAAERHHVEVKLARNLPHLEGSRAGNVGPGKAMHRGAAFSRATGVTAGRCQSSRSALARHQRRSSPSRCA